MSLLEVNKITPQSGTTLTLGDTGDTINFGSGVLPNFENLTVTGDLTVDTNSLYVDSANNRVGIGTTSPTESLYVQGSGTTRGEFKSTGSGSASSVGAVNDTGSLGRVLMFGSTQGAYGSLGSGEMALYSNTAGMSIMNDNASGAIKFSMQSGAEKMRIDSSGNVLVGKTTTDFGTVGFRVQGSTGATEIVRDGGKPLTLNRLNSDGIMLGFSVSGTDEGAIVVASGGTLSIGAQNTHLKFQHSDSTIRPSNSSFVNRDNAIDLGASNSRFKDLYLGGNAYASIVNINNASAQGRLNVSNNGAEQLEVFPGDVAGKVSLQAFNRSDTTYDSFRYIGLTHEFLISGTEKMRIDSNGNVGIGTSSPDRSLHINTPSTQLKLQDSGQTDSFFEIVDSAGIVYMGSRNNTNNGQFVFRGLNSGGASEYMRIDSSGNVGIGTSSPSEKLSVVAEDDSSAIDNGFAIYRSVGDDKVNINAQGGAAKFIADGGSTYIPYRFYGYNGTTLAERLTIDGDGNVGINTSSPTAYAGQTNLNINSTGVSRIDFDINNSLQGFLVSESGYIGLYANTGNVLRLGANNSEKMRIDTSGNVGIGTTSPTGSGQVLHLNSSTTVTDFHMTNSTTGSASTDGLVIRQSGLNSEILNREAGNTIFYNNGAESMRINSTGDVSIGSTANSGYKLKVDAQGDSLGAGYMLSDVYNQPSFEVTNTNTSNFAQSVLWLQCNRTTTNGSYNFLRVIQQGVTDKLFIRDSGNVVNANNSYGSISDSKLKEQITDASSQWSDIKNIQIKKFKFKHEVAEGDSDSLWKLGVIAQEIETVSPSLVETVQDIDKEGNAVLDDEGNETYTKNVKYSVLYMKAVKALQEAMQKIEDLEARVDTLEGN